jgi:hypothetical protein
MSSKSSQKRDIKKIDEPTLNRLYYIRFLFGVLSGFISGIIPPLFAPLSILVLIFVLLFSNTIMRSLILKNQADPPLTHGIGIYILSWVVFFGISATLFWVYLF